MIDDSFFRYQNNLNGTKGLIIVGDKLLVYRRDGNTKKHPFEIDVPGGGSEVNESGYDTFARESMEEFGLVVNKEDIIYAKKYSHTEIAGEHAYFCVARLSETAQMEINFGEEGVEYYLMAVQEYLNHPEGWTMFQERAQEYYNSSK